MASLEQESYRIHYRTIVCLQSLSAYKISVGQLQTILGDSKADIGNALQDLVLLGEIELCSIQETGGQVWLKRQKEQKVESDSELSGHVWKCYIALSPRHRVSDRLFRTREAAVDHLRKTNSIPPQRFVPVPYLRDVLYTPVEDEMPETEAIAVVRREPIFETESFWTLQPGSMLF